MAPSLETKLRRYMRIFNNLCNDITLGVNNGDSLTRLIITLFNNGFCVNTQFNNGNNLLMHLLDLNIYISIHSIAILLINKGINIHHRNNDGFTALNICTSKYDNEQEQSIRYAITNVIYTIDICMR